MSEDQVRKYVTYLLPLVVGAVMLGCGIGGCVEYQGPDPTLPRSFPDWPTTTQIDYLKARDDKRTQHQLMPKSELAAPVVFVPLIIVGLIVGVAGVVIICRNEMA